MNLSQLKKNYTLIISCCCSSEATKKCVPYVYFLNHLSKHCGNTNAGLVDKKNSKGSVQILFVHVDLHTQRYDSCVQG